MLSEYTITGKVEQYGWTLKISFHRKGSESRVTMELRKPGVLSPYPTVLEAPFDEAALCRQLKELPKRMGEEEAEAFTTLVIEKMREMSSMNIEAPPPDFFIEAER